MALKPGMGVSRNENIELSRIAEFPVLKSVLECWAEAAEGRTPAAIDPLDLAPSAWPYLMLVDLVGNEDAIIRLAGTAACDIYGHELKGTSVHDFFGAEDASLVLRDLNDVAIRESPMLTRRSYVSINGRPWSYVRLLLPLRPDGEHVTRIIKALEPDRFVGQDG